MSATAAGEERAVSAVALLTDLIHNAGDALTAVPIGAAFLLRRALGRLSGLLAIFVSACVALVETIDRLIHPQELSDLWAFAGAGVTGFLGNEIAASVRLRAGRRLDSPRSSPMASTPGWTVSSPWVLSQALSSSRLAGRQATDRGPFDHARHPQGDLGLVAHHPRRRTRPRRLGRDLPNAPAWFNNAGDGKNVAGGQALPSPDQYSPRRAR